MIRLTRATTETPDLDTTCVWPLTVTADIVKWSTDDPPVLVVDTDSLLSPAIFVYHCGITGDPDSDVFEAVASPIQLEQLPATRPTADALLTQPYYRQSSATIYCAYAQQAYDLWQELKVEAAILAEEWSRAQTLATTDTYVTPTL